MTTPTAAQGKVRLRDIDAMNLHVLASRRVCGATAWKVRRQTLRSCRRLLSKGLAEELPRGLGFQITPAGIAWVAAHGEKPDVK